MKKFSKKLFCLMLVAIMVATAIPFGAFAETPDGTTVFTIKARYKDSAHGGTIGTGSFALPDGFDPSKASDCVNACAGAGIDVSGRTFLNAIPEFEGTSTKLTVVFANEHSWTFVSATSTDHTMRCTVGGEDKTEAHSFNSVGKCTVCGWGHDHDFTGGAVSGPYDASGHKVQCTFPGCTEKTTVPHGSEHFDVLPAEPADCENTGFEAGKRYDCGYVEGHAVTDALGHIDENCDGVCDRTGCGASVPVTKVTYKVCVKLSSTSATLAEGKSVEYTEAQVKALDGATAVRSFLNGLGGDYAKVAGDMADNNFDKVTRELGSVDSYLYVWLKSVGSESEDTSGKIQVVYDDGKIEYRSMRVGSWYFSSSNLGLDDTWGTTQAKLKIYDANGSRTVQWDSEDNDAFVKATDYKVEVKGINRTVTIYFMKTSTANPTTTDAFATKYYEANTRLGVLPSLPDGYTGWYVGQEELTVDTVYHWKEKSVYAYPGKGVGSGRVHLFIYNKDNQLMKNVDVTENVQDNGLITKTGLMKTIEYQTGRKNPTVAGLFDESGWAYYLNNKNSTAKAKSSVDVGRAADRQGTQNIYVVLTNVSGGSNADTSNPKTGDTAMIGTAAIVMALAAVGMGTAFYMKKKELF